MRVIAGEFRSRLLKAVPGLDVRPTPDRLRQTLFNILAPKLTGAVFLDAYAGSGAVGIEALSRGAKHALFIENSREALAVLEGNLRSLGLVPRSTVLRGPVGKKISPELADIVFLDPPYPLQAEYGMVLDQLGASDGRARLVIAQHASRVPLLDGYRMMRRRRVVRQGENSLSFFEPAASEEP